ncbi:MAG: alpha-N-arabinofuranosidase, partial [Chloroflexi bacterium]|nr:alpha-N-arabinofuranosidase [Chloroflexota bacterium]
ANNMQAIFIVNRSQTGSITTELHWQDRTPEAIRAAHQLSDPDPTVFNSFENPNRVVPTRITTPRLDGQSAVLELPPLSFTALEVKL